MVPALRLLYENAARPSGPCALDGCTAQVMVPGFGAGTPVLGAGFGAAVPGADAPADGAMADGAMTAGADAPVLGSAAARPGVNTITAAAIRLAAVIAA